MTAYDRLVDALRVTGAKVTASRDGQAKAQCPAHEDRSPSLSVTRIETMVLVYCHAGCSVDDVLAALDLTKRDLYDDPGGPRYNYRDKSGTVLRTVRRTASKGFSQSGYTKGPGTLYRLQAVVAAVEAERVVYVVEGEKDVHAVESLGAVATTAPMGAGKWHLVDSTPLHGAKVVIVADRDGPGLKHARDVWASLEGMVPMLRVVQAKVGKDAADHIAAGHTLDELEPVELDVQDAGEPDDMSRSGVVTLSDVEPEKVSYLWPGRFPLGKLVIIDGDPSTGKSTLALDVASHVSTGLTWPDGAAGSAPADVLLLSAEDGLSDTISPRLIAAAADRKRIHAVMEVAIRNEDGDLRMVPPSLPRDIAMLEELIDEYDVRLVIIDVFMAYLNSKVDSHRDQDVRGVLHQLAAMADRKRCTVVLIRHLNKAPGTNALYRGGGSIGIVGAARAGFLVARDPEDTDRRIFACVKMNLAVEPPSLAYRLVSDPLFGCARVEWEPEAVEHTATSLLRSGGDDEDFSERDEAAQWLLGYLAEQGGSAAARDVFKACRAEHIAERTLQRARKRAGVVSERKGFQAGATWYIPATVPPYMSTNSAGMYGASGGVEAQDEPVQRLFDEPIPGRCESCEYHVETQGHAPTCERSEAS